MSNPFIFGTKIAEFEHQVLPFYKLKHQLFADSGVRVSITERTIGTARYSVCVWRDYEVGHE